MPSSKSDQWEIDNRRERIGRLYLQGMTQREIVEQMEKWGTKVSQSTVSNDLAAIRELWLSRSAGLFNAKMAEEVAKLDRMEREAWDNYEASKKRENRTEETREKEHEYELVPGEGETPLQQVLNGQRVRVPSKSKIKRVVKENLPSKDWWDRILEIVKYRCQLFGLVKPDTNTTNVVVLNWEQLMGGPASQEPEIDPIRAALDAERNAGPAPKVRVVPPEPPVNGNGTQGPAHGPKKLR